MEQVSGEVASVVLCSNSTCSPLEHPTCVPISPLGRAGHQPHSSKKQVCACVPLCPFPTGSWPEVLTGAVLFLRDAGDSRCSPWHSDMWTESRKVPLLHPSHHDTEMAGCSGAAAP